MLLIKSLTERFSGPTAALSVRSNTGTKSEAVNSSDGWLCEHF